MDNDDCLAIRCSIITSNLLGEPAGALPVRSKLHYLGANSCGDLRGHCFGSFFLMFCLQLDGDEKSSTDDEILMVSRFQLVYHS